MLDSALREGWGRLVWWPGEGWADIARDGLLETFSSSGVVRIEFVIGFVKPYQVSVWLGTTTDSEKVALSERVGLSQVVAAVLGKTEMGERDCEFDGGVVVQSEETVQRDYKGSWFYALR